MAHGGDQRDDDPVALAASLLGDDLARLTEDVPDDSLVDQSIEDASLLDLTPQPIVDRATEREEGLVAIPVLDLGDEDEEPTAADIRLPVLPPPPLGPGTPTPAQPGVRPPPPMAHPVAVGTPSPARPLASPAPLAQPVPVAQPVPMAQPVPVAQPVAQPKPVTEPLTAAPTPAATPPAVRVIRRPAPKRPVAPRKPTQPLGSARILPPKGPLPGTDPRIRPEPSVVLDFGSDSEAMTEVFEHDRPRELPRGRLVVTGGPDDGKTWYLNRPVTFLGRGQDCDIVLLDHSVSRRHLRVDRTGDGFSVTDDGSGNGTWLNGARVTRDALFDGDRLLVGDTTLVFTTVGLPRRRPVVGGQVTDPGHRPQVKGPSLADRLPQVPVRWVLAWVATTLVAVAVTVSVVRLVRARRYAQARAVAESWRSKAVDAVAQRQWPQAREALQAAEALDPALLDYSAEYQRLGQAVRDAQVLARARQALAAGDVAEALAQVGHIAPDSPYAFDARMLRRRAEAALTAPRPPTPAPSPR